MSEHKIYPIPAAFVTGAHITPDKYRRMYERSLNDAEAFWSEQAEAFVTWEKKWSKVSQTNFAKGEAAWFVGGKLNLSINCIDRHLPARASQTAIIWEGDNPAESQHITYQQLSDRVCALANGLKSRGVKKGDRVCI